jgi:hypothetical protein
MVLTLQVQAQDKYLQVCAALQAPLGQQPYGQSYRPKSRDEAGALN